MGLIHYLVCWKHMAAVDLDKSSIRSKREISYNKYEPDWRSFIQYTRPYVLKDLQDFIDEHEYCRLYLSYDSGDLPWDDDNLKPWTILSGGKKRLTETVTPQELRNRIKLQKIAEKQHVIMNQNIEPTSEQ